MNRAAGKLMALIDPERHRRPGDQPRLPVAHPASIAFTAAFAALAAAWLAPPSLALVTAAAAAFIPTLVWIDLDLHRLPDALTRPALGVVMAAAVITSIATSDYHHLAVAVTAAVAAGLVLCLLGIAVPGGPGLGDAKAAPIFVLPLAWQSTATVLTWAVLSCVAGCIGALVLLARHGDRRQHLPFGPSMAAAWFLTLAFAKSGVT